jgi:hypothetical protein
MTNPHPFARLNHFASDSEIESHSISGLVLVGWLIPAHAAPPTVTPSPGYDARLQEQRAASARVYEPVAPVVRPVTPRRGKRTPTH